MDLPGQIMNLRCNVEHNRNAMCGDDAYLAYKDGHRDARHAAAELAMKADACIAALRQLNARLRQCSRDQISAAEAYDSYYQQLVAEALAEFGDV